LGLAQFCSLLLTPFSVLSGDGPETKLGGHRGGHEAGQGCQNGRGQSWAFIWMLMTGLYQSVMEHLLFEQSDCLKRVDSGRHCVQGTFKSASVFSSFVLSFQTVPPPFKKAFFSFLFKILFHFTIIQGIRPSTNELWRRTETLSPELRKDQTLGQAACLTPSRLLGGSVSSMSEANRTV
jgi:hypothetical protein